MTPSTVSKRTPPNNSFARPFYITTVNSTETKTTHLVSYFTILLFTSIRFHRFYIFYTVFNLWIMSRLPLLWLLKDISLCIIIISVKVEWCRFGFRCDRTFRVMQNNEISDFYVASTRLRIYLPLWCKSVVFLDVLLSERVFCWFVFDGIFIKVFRLWAYSVLLHM